MSEIELDKALLNYKKYFVLKGKFENTKIEEDELDLDEFLHNENYNQWKKEAFRKVLKELLKYLRNYGVFISHGGEACRYISYIFSKEVKDKGYIYDQKIFEMFQRFVDKFNNRPGYISSHCSTGLVHVNFDIYDKMEKLYSLYEEFKKFKDDYPLWKAESCLPIYTFLNLYNDFIRKNQPTNNHFKHILDEFSKEIIERKGLYNTHKCPGKYIHVENIKSPILPKEEQPEALVQVQQKPNHTQHEVSQSKTPPSLTEHRTVYSHPEVHHAKSQTYHAQSEKTHEQPQPIREDTQPFQERVAPNAQHAERQQVQRFAERGIPEGELDVDLSQVNLQYNGSLESPQTSSYPEHYPYSSVLPSSNDVEDTSSSVMNTITRALKDVEPGPVLGVSGGMGVLFLLFKYTPVGSFFGGRRGRFRQIPSSFRGFPPDFANFQEYGGGYVGYSPMDINPLAE